MSELFLCCAHCTPETCDMTGHDDRCFHGCNDDTPTPPAGADASTEQEVERLRGVVESLCPDCGGDGYTTRSEHGPRCGGTCERCPVQVQEQYQATAHEVAAVCIAALRERDEARAAIARVEALLRTYGFLPPDIRAALRGEQ